MCCDNIMAFLLVCAALHLQSSVLFEYFIEHVNVIKLLHLGVEITDDYYLSNKCIEQLTSMEMEVCDASSARKLGDALSAFFAGMSVAAAANNSEFKPEKVSTNNNALTSSGALGSTCERVDCNANNNNG